MTQNQVDLKAEIIKLVRNNTIEQQKLDKYLPRIDNLITFYEGRIPEVPEKMGWTFTGYVYSLTYLMSIVNKHIDLIDKLEELVGGEK